MKELEFFIDVLKILPEDILCLIQAPSLQNKEILKLMIDTEFPYFKLVKLDINNKNEFSKLLDESTVQDFHHIEIKSDENNKKLFEGWDGVEFCHFSKTVKIPAWFQEKYLDTEMYHVSDEW